MREVSGGLSALSQTQLFLPRGIKTIRWENLKGGRLKTNERWRCHAKNHNKLSTFSSRYSTDVPLYESPGVLISLSLCLPLSFCVFLMLYTNL